MRVRVTQAEILQRIDGGDGWRKPEVGDIINVSAVAAAVLFRKGYAEPLEATSEPEADPLIVKAAEPAEE